MDEAAYRRIARMADLDFDAVDIPKEFFPTKAEWESARTYVKMAANTLSLSKIELAEKFSRDPDMTLVAADSFGKLADYLLQKVETIREAEIRTLIRASVIGIYKN